MWRGAPGKVRALLLLSYPRAECGCSGDPSRGGSVIRSGRSLVARAGPGDAKALACIRMAVFYT